jgi:arylformamidase
MTWQDVTRPLEDGMLVFSGEIKPEFHQEKHGSYLISELLLSSHSGTHIDAPAHYLKTGDSIDKIPLGNLIGGCRIVDVSDSGIMITKDTLSGKIEGAERILLKTLFSGKDSFKEDYPCLSLDGAVYITSCGIRCIGIDSPSIESFVCDGSVHRHLLGSGCLIIELLDLSAVGSGEYEMIALPLRLKGLDGSPARVIVRKYQGRK